MNTAAIDEIVANAVKNSNDRQDLWVRLLTDFKCRNLCEVGVWRGEFAQHILGKIAGIESYTLVDPWRNLPSWNKPANKSDIEFDEIRKEALGRVSAHSNKITEVRDTTKMAKDKIPDGSLDFVYIDGDHTLRGITLDLNCMLPKIRKAGFIGGDDFSKTIWQHHTSFSPTEVFPYAIYFAEAFDMRIYTLPFSQFLIVNSSDGFEVIDHGGYSDLSPAEIYAPPAVPPSRLILNRLKIAVGSVLPSPLKSLIKRLTS